MRRGLIGWWLSLVLGAGWLVHGFADGSGSATAPGFEPGKGYGWIWGEEDEVGALNAMTPDTVSAALSLVSEGRMYDLGVSFDRESFKWPGHNPTEVMTFRSPHGVITGRDINHELFPSRTTWHSCALFISDNVGTQLDGLGHVVTGESQHWYNGFREAEWGGDFGVRRCDANTIPPIISRGVMIDVAGYKEVDALPASYGITVTDLEGALARQGTELRPGDTVLLRTGTLRYWGENGSDLEKIAAHDSAGARLETARWLVEENGAILVGSDTSGFEVAPPPEGSSSFVPVHEYLLIEQGVHIAEFHFLEELARDGVYEFCYVALANKIRGATAGFCLRPIAIR